jgi:hypothetical protein
LEEPLPAAKADAAFAGIVPATETVAASAQANPIVFGSLTIAPDLADARQRRRVELWLALH